MFEGARRGPLGRVVGAEEAEDDGGEDTIEGAEGKGEVGEKKAGQEGGGGDTADGEGVEGGREKEVDKEELDEEGDDNVHFRQRRKSDWREICGRIGLKWDFRVDLAVWR